MWPTHWELGLNIFKRAEILLNWEKNHTLFCYRSKHPSFGEHQWRQCICMCKKIEICYFCTSIWIKRPFLAASGQYAWDLHSHHSHDSLEQLAMASTRPAPGIMAFRRTGPAALHTLRTTIAAGVISTRVPVWYFPVSYIMVHFVPVRYDPLQYLPTSLHPRMLEGAGNTQVWALAHWEVHLAVEVVLPRPMQPKRHHCSRLELHAILRGPRANGCATRPPPDEHVGHPRFGDAPFPPCRWLVGGRRTVKRLRYYSRAPGGGADTRRKTRHFHSVFLGRWRHFWGVIIKLKYHLNT
jgi:hypothetical protein